ILCSTKGTKTHRICKRAQQFVPPTGSLPATLDFACRDAYGVGGWLSQFRKPRSVPPSPATVVVASITFGPPAPSGGPKAYLGAFRSQASAEPAPRCLFAVHFR